MDVVQKQHQQIAELQKMAAPASSPNDLPEQVVGPQVPASGNCVVCYMEVILQVSGSMFHTSPRHIFIRDVSSVFPYIHL